MTTSMSRYVEMSLTLDPTLAKIAQSKTDPFDTNSMAVFIEHGGVTVVIPAVSGPYAHVVTTAINNARELLDRLIPGDVSIPVPWRVTMLDRELMETNLLQARDLEATSGPQDDDNAAGAAA